MRQTLYLAFTALLISLRDTKRNGCLVLRISSIGKCYLFCLLRIITHSPCFS